MKFAGYFFRYVCARLIYDGVRAAVRRPRNQKPHCHSAFCFLVGLFGWFSIACVVWAFLTALLAR